MSESNWQEQAAKVFRDVASRPVFPGDEDPLFPLFHKLVNRLYAECHNDGPIGKDGCAACRAHRVEEFVKLVDSQKEKIDELENRVREGEEAVRSLEEVSGEQAREVEFRKGQLQELDKEFREALERAADFETSFKASEADLVVYHDENVRLREHINHQNAEVSELRHKVDIFRNFVDQVKGL